MVLLRLLLACAIVPLAHAADPSPAPAPLPAKLVIGHRGASALRPEHTLGSYTKAIEDGADVIEPDLVISKDGTLVVRHENEIGGTTDVASRPEFAARKTTKTIDGQAVTGWFAEDFTLAELKTLRATERIPANRPANTQYNGRYEIPTLQEVIDLARRKTAETGRTIAIYPETKHPSYFKAIGLPLEKRLVEALHANGYRGRKAPVFIQSFEPGSLKEMRIMTDLPMVQLMTSKGQPEDWRLAGDKRGYAEMATPEGLREVASYADGIGPTKEMVIPRDASKNLGTPTALVRDAHAAKLLVHPYTFRPENPFLPMNLRGSEPASPSQRGDLMAELKAYLDAGIDGFFTDDPGVGRAAMDAYGMKQ
ncbi:glycerophosphodiester phosphodiesterase [Oxalobacteraceae bacterium OM1]|nr:glycerophosphodiester phosphodiesterase [Oxalobacteraceae bacterium OM1]